MSDTWRKSGETWYYLGEDGNMVKDATVSVNDDTFYLDTGGAMVKNRWVSVKNDDAGSDWYYFGNEGKAYKGKKYYASSTDQSLQRDIDCKSYLFDEFGVMIPQLSMRNANLAVTSSNATIQYGSLDNEGEQKDEYWTFTVPNEVMSAKDYSTGERSRFRNTKDGHVIKDKIGKVIGRKYAFDEIGRMQTGFVIMLEDGTFGIKYDSDQRAILQRVMTSSTLTD